jgi:6-carboxyhexanoate--CoA ligase
MSTPLYSLRMRAERAGTHCSGAERIATPDQLPALAAALVARALGCAGGPPDAVHCTVEALAAPPLRRPLPPVSTYTAPDWQGGRACARALLIQAGVAAPAVATALELLAAGPAPGGEVMRGAAIVDAVSGARLEADPAKGVRVSRMDLLPEARAAVEVGLAAAGLGHPRVLEALLLAGKVLGAPGLVAELCWSDDPEYATGYVADPQNGYQRIVPLKALGDPKGGRVFFVRRDGWDRERFVAALERAAVLFDALGPISPPRAWEE